MVKRKNKKDNRFKVVVIILILILIGIYFWSKGASVPNPPALP
jgi:hypothetical protein